MIKFVFFYKEYIQISLFESFLIKKSLISKFIIKLFKPFENKF